MVKAKHNPSSIPSKSSPTQKSKKRTNKHIDMSVLHPEHPEDPSDDELGDRISTENPEVDKSGHGKSIFQLSKMKCHHIHDMPY